MNWRSLLTSPSPDAVWSVDQEIVAVSRRDRGGVFRCAATELAADAVELGAVGLQAVDAAVLETAFRNLHSRVASTSRPAVVIPSGWTRSFLIEGSDLPSRRSDLDDVLRWRLKKLLPAPPAELRLATVFQPAEGDTRHLVCTAVKEKAIAGLEAAFRNLKIRPGLIVPRILALSLPGEDDRLIIEQDADVIAISVVASGGIRFLRTKPLPKDRAAWPDLVRELALTVNYIRNNLGVSGPLEARSTARDGDVQQLIGRHLQEHDGLKPMQPSAGAVCPDAAIAQHLGPARLAAMAAVFEEGHPR